MFKMPFEERKDEIMLISKFIDEANSTIEFAITELLNFLGSE